MFSPEKLFEIMRKKEFSNQKLVEALNNMGIKIKADAFKSYKQHRASPRIEVLCGIVDVLDIVEQDLFEVTEYKRKLLHEKYTLNSKNKLSGDIQLDEKMISIPLVYAGAGAEAFNDSDNDEIIYLEKYLFKELYTKNEIVAVKVLGNSMEPNILENDLMIIEMMGIVNYQKIDDIYLVRYGDVVQIKQVQFLGNGEILLKSINSDYAPINPSKDYNMDWEILGKPIMKISIERYSKINSKF